MKAIGIALAMGLAASAVYAAEVTVAIVTMGREGPQPISERQSLWASPFGGWVVATWPFGMRVDDQPLMEFSSRRDKLLQRAAADRLDGDAALIDGLLEKTIMPEGSKEADEDSRVFRFNRQSAVRLNLGAGRHTLQPFDIVFTVGSDGVPASQDPRLRIDAEARRVEVLCHPVVLRTVAAERTVAAPLALTLDGRSLLGGLEPALAAAASDAASKAVQKEGGHTFFRVTVYLPSSASGKPYAVNGVRFTLDPAGQVTLLEESAAQAGLIGGCEIRLASPSSASPAAAGRRVGVRWLRAAGEGVAITAGGASVVSRRSEGSGFLALPDASRQPLQAGALTAFLPAADPALPCALLLWDGEAKAAWLVEMPALASRPGDVFRCRVTHLCGDASVLPAALRLKLEDAATGAAGGRMDLVVADGLYTGTVPDTVGVWRLRAADDTPLRGQVLGLAVIATGEAASLSFFTVRNRGLFRRGDAVDVFWAARFPPGQVVARPVVLRGPGLETEVGTVTVSGTGKGTGRLTLDTAALAPGDYELTVARRDAACYPLRFRICQREPLSAYELYAYVYNKAEPHAGSPVSAYYGKIPGGPGLDPFRTDGDASLDPAFAAYGDAPGGPVLEKFDHPTGEEAALMALAGLGMRAVPAYPPLLHHEDWNPKHTLPEDLAQMRRRLALFAQPLADVAGFGGFALGWYASLTGYWEESPPLDGHQARRNAAADAWIAARVAEETERARAGGVAGEALERLRGRAPLRFRSTILPLAFESWLADVRQMLPGLTAHNALPSWWLGGGQGYAPYAYATLTQRDTVDYSDYGITAWGNFRAPAWMAIGNPQGQKLHGEFMTIGRHSRFATAFGAAGRGLDGLSLTLDNPHPQGEDEALLRIFERFGPYFSALEPLPDVAVYVTDTNPQNVVLHDLARMRRPGMLLGPEDVLAGSLAKYRVLFLVSARAGEPEAVLNAFKAFEAAGGVILKDRTCHASLPGRDIGFGYDGAQVHPVWGLAYANGEDEFAHLWKNFKETREPFLVNAFATIPPIPVGTPDADVVISPLAGKDSILCFVINQTLVPLTVAGKWRQHAVLPKVGELLVENGWRVRDLLTGRDAAVERTAAGGRVAVDFTRAEGAVYLLTRCELAGMVMRTERASPHALRLNAWLADAADAPLTDPAPFEVTLRDPDGETCFRVFTALGPERAIEVPVPARSDGRSLLLTVRDLVLGSVAEQAVAPAAPATVAATTGPDVVGGVGVAAAFVRRSGPVTVLLDEGQEAFRPAATELAALFIACGREARVKIWDPAEVRPLPLRWQPLPEDLTILEALREGAFVWRVGLGAVSKEDAKGNKRVLFDDPGCGYDEYGPRLRHDADVVLFGSPANNRALAQLEPYLRRRLSANARAPFIHYLWSPFQGGYDGLYLGCHDAGDAAAAVAALKGLADLTELPSALPGAPASQPVVTRGGPPGPPDERVAGAFGTRVLDLAFAPDGGRLFVTTDSYGESLFALGADGSVQEKRALANRCGNNLWQRAGGRLRPVDDATVQVTVGADEYRFSFEKGWLNREDLPPTGFTGRFSVPVAAATVWRDEALGRAFLGGQERLTALSRDGRRLWVFDDTAVRQGTDDLLYPRCIFPRAVSGDGRVLLVAGFGIRHDVYAAGSAVNTSVAGLDAATGKLLWQRDGMLLNVGKAVAMGDHFLIIDDGGNSRVVRAADGRDASRLRSVGSADWILPVPGRGEILVVDNTAFDRQGPTARVYFRPLGDTPDRPLDVGGRVTDALVSPDGQTVTLVTAHGAVLRFDVSGALVWRAEAPSGGLVRLSPDGRFVWVGARNGIVRRFSAADGRALGATDLNPFNVTTGERFVRQAGEMGDLPFEQGMAMPPEPSYLTSLDRGKVAFGANLLPEDRLRPSLHQADAAADDPARAAVAGRLEPDASFTLSVEAGKTYLVELLAAAADAGSLTPQTRLEVAVTGPRKTANLPFVGRLPLTRLLTRRRAAFRADEAGEVTLTLRAVWPRTVGEGKAARLTYDGAASAPAGLVVGEVLVSAIEVRGRNVLYDGGPASKAKPLGNLACDVKPWTGGSSLVRNEPYACPQAALRLVDGVIANQETAWTQEAKGAEVDHANGYVRFRAPQTLSAIAVYEDPSGPVPSGSGVAERTAMRYAVYVRTAKTRQWVCVGRVSENTQLVNLFACPDEPVDEIRYLWAGRNDAARMDGIVRMAEFEAYADDLGVMMDALGTGLF